MCHRLQSLNDFSVGEGFIGQKKEWEHSLCQAVHVTQKPEPKGMQGCRTIAALEAYLQYLSVLKWVYQGKTTLNYYIWHIFHSYRENPVGLLPSSVGRFENTQSTPSKEYLPNPGFKMAMIYSP